MEAKTYNQKGKEVGTITLPENIFGVVWNGDLVHQVVLAMQANARTNVAHTKDRGDVRGGGKKPWRQKGTGRARHGSIRSPLWVGGGVTFGPRNEKDYSQKVNKRMRSKALFTILSRMQKEGSILFINELSFGEIKAKTAKEVLENLSSIKGFKDLATKRRNSVLIATAQKDNVVFKSFGNFSNVAIEEVRNLNPIDVLQYKYLVIVGPDAALDFLKEKLEKKPAEASKTNLAKS